jgi:phage regulator Rha-like protein
MDKSKSLVPVEMIEQSILLMRGQRVILDNYLAKSYGVTTKRLNEQVKRNSDRFPADFMFQLTSEEHNSLRSQFATLKDAGTGRGRHRKYPPFVFTEHGAIMAASVLNTPKAIDMSVLVVRAFVKLRELLSSHRQLASKLNQLEHKVARHDKSISAIFDAIRQLMNVSTKQKQRIGFKTGKTSGK